MKKHCFWDQLHHILLNFQGSGCSKLNFGFNNMNSEKGRQTSNENGQWAWKQVDGEKKICKLLIRNLSHRLVYRRGSPSWWCFLWSCENFKKWGLAGGSRSLCVKRPSLSMSPSYVSASWLSWGYRLPSTILSMQWYLA